MHAMKQLSGTVWRKARSFFSLIHDWDDVRETYGDNPNGLSDEERLTARAVASNIVNIGGTGGFGG